MLNPQQLRMDILDLLEDFDRTQDPERVREEFADKLSIIIHNYVSKAIVTVQAGIPVQVLPSTGTGGTTAVGIGELS